MARGRFISKEISLDEKVNSLPDDTCRLLFTWLIPHLDCEGRMHGDAITVKSIVFPRKDISNKKIENYLEILEKFGLILRYFVNGNQYLCSINFEKHQPGLQKNKEAQSQIPAPTPELLQSYSRKWLTQVKVKDQDQVKVKDLPPYIPPTGDKTTELLNTTKKDTELLHAIKKPEDNHSREREEKKNIPPKKKDGGEDKKTFGEQFHNIRLTPEEHAKLVERFGAQGATNWIDELSLAKASKGYKSVSDYATILAWERRRIRLGELDPRQSTGPPGGNGNGGHPARAGFRQLPTEEQRREAFKR